MPVSVLGRVPVNRGDILPVSGSLLPVTAGLQLWLRGDMGVTLNDATVTFPNDFDNAAWTKVGATVSPDATTDPFGGNLADSLIEDGSVGGHFVLNSIGSLVAIGGSVSLYAKAGARTWLALSFAGGGSAVYFNLVAGVVGSTVGPNVTGASITSVGNGWYHLEVFTSLLATSYAIFMATADGVSSYAGDGASNVFLYGAAASQPKVSAWTDQSGQGHNAVQATAVSQPFWNPVGLNGKPSILWDGINDSMAANGLAAMMNGTDLPFTLIVVGHYVSLAAFVQPVCWSYSASGAPFQRWLLDGSLNYNTSRRDDAASVATGVGPLATTVPPVVLTEVFHGTTDQFFVSGTPRAGDPAPMDVGLISLMDRFTLGAIDIGGPTAFANFLIAEVIVYSTALSTADRQAVESYLYQRYNLPSFFDPTSLPGCALWLRADLGVTLSNPTILAANAFSSASWFKGFSSVVADATTDPFGGTLADSLVEDLSNGNHYLFQFISNRVAGLPETVSLYAKAGTRSWLALGDDTGVHWAFVDLATGSLGTVTGATATVTDAGNGWWLIQVTSTGFDGAFTCFMATGNNGNSYVGNGTGNIFLYGANVSQPTVSSWADQSGFAHDAIQATKANQPFWAASAQNGQPAARSNGTTESMTLPSFALAAFTVVACYSVTSKQAFSGPFAVKTPGTAGFEIGSDASTTTYMQRLIGWNGAVETPIAEDVDARSLPTAQHTYAWTSAGAYQIDGVVQATSATAAGFTNSLTLFRNGDGFMGMDLLELVIYSRVLSSPELAQLQAYLKSRYATP